MAHGHQSVRGSRSTLAAPGMALLLCAAPLAGQTSAPADRNPRIPTTCPTAARDTPPTPPATPGSATPDHAGPAPTGSGPRGAPILRLEIERHVGCLELAPPRELPRFEEKVDVEGRTAEALLARFVEPQELLRGATPGGAPGVAEMQEYRPGATPGLNLLPVFAALGRALGLGKSSGARAATGSFFLYRVRSASGDWPLVRDGRLPSEALSAAPGVSFELLGEYPDWGAALAAYRKLDSDQGRAAARVELPRPGPTP